VLPAVAQAAGVAEAPPQPIDVTLSSALASAEQLGAAPGVADRARFEAALERARAELGDAAERAYAAGRALNRDDAIAYALMTPSSG
jgi:hypothetical protein